MAIQVSVSNLNPTPGEIVTFTGSADPVEDISMNVYNENGEHIAVYTIYLKTHGINSVRLVPGILKAIVQTWKFVGIDTRTEAPPVTITIQTVVPPQLTITLSANKTTIEPDDIVTFQISTNPAATYTVTLEAYVGGVRKGLWRTPITDGYGIKQLKPGQIADVVEWIVKDDNGNVSNTVTTTVSATGPTEGIIQAIRIQDVPRQIWYSWDKGIGWSPRAPVITPGVGAFYAAFYGVNNGAAGNITITIKDDQGITLSSKTESIAAGAGIGVEYTGTMPDRYYGITLVASPGETTQFTIMPYTGVPPPPPDGIMGWWNNLPTLQKALIASGAIVAVIGGSYVITKKK